MPIGFNPAPPTPSTKNTINSVTIGTNTGFNIRDFLLNKNLNLISTSAYQNYTFYDNSVSNNYSFLSTSINGSPKIGEPVLNTMVGNGNITIPFGLPLETEGLYHMDNLIILNQYQNTEPDYNSLTIIDNLPQAPTSWGDVGIIDGLYPTKPNEVIDVNGLLAKSNAMSKSQETGFLSTKASDATLMNLYLDVTKQINASDYINFNSNVTTQIKGYLDEYGSLNVGGPSTDATNVIGSILNGQGVGVSKTGVVPNFDIRSSLAGRVLGATGIINDTKLGLIGGQQLALALANNAAFNIQQDILGSLNVQDNILSLVKGDGVVGFRPNYSITVPSSTTGKLLNGTSQILGFTLPRSFLSDSGSIFQDENKGAENIARANEMILNTGKGQVQALLANMTASIAVNNMGNTFRSGYAPAFNDNKGKEMITDYKLYAYYNGEGHFINPLAMTDGVIPDIQINRNVSEFSFKSPEEKFTGPRGNAGYENHKISDVGFTWTSNKDGTVNAHPEAAEIDDDADVNGRALKKSLLVKTQALFNSKGMINLITAKGQMDQTASQIQTAIVNGGISHGSAVMDKDMFTPDGVFVVKEKTAEETYCRSWTTLDRYDKMKNLVRHRGLDTTVPYRRNVEGSVLDDNGMPKIAPYSTDNDDPKKFMFSIENLAWNDSYYNLLPCERGPGDLLTGKKGRIMWFPPYNINFTENNAVSWDSNQFIGRGESVYTYSNTERSGTLSFQVIVDHPSYINSFKGSKVDDHYVASFFAGCVTPDQAFSKKLTAFELDTVIVNNAVPLEIQEANPPIYPFDKDKGFNVYFPNDVYTYVEDYENGLKNKTNPGNPIGYTSSDVDGFGEGIGWMAGQITSKTTYNDRYNYGLNGSQNTGAKVSNVGYDGFTPQFLGVLNEYLNLDANKHIILTVEGYATEQGKVESNKDLAGNRANTLVSILKAQVFSGLTTEEQNKRVKKLPNGTQTQDGTCNDKLDIQDLIGCKSGRYATVRCDVDWSLITEKLGIPFERTTTTTTNTLEDPFYGECRYFEKLTDEDSFIFDKFRDKIKYFHPAFHSTTPEGLNARLTFLLQCTRQGPTLEEQGATNLAFGRPPVCILRIGDFYNTKIVIDNIGLDYEPLVWDLNPEGIGVQPMIANVNMSFKFIGGSTLLGPINKLQNALSFNYFANTQVYDVRADYISKKVTKKNPTGGYQITNDAKDEYEGDLNKGLGVPVQKGDPRIVVENINQVATSDKTTDGVQETEPIDLVYKVGAFNATYVSTGPLHFLVDINFTAYDSTIGEFVDVTPAILEALYTDVDGAASGYKISIKDVNSPEIYEINIPTTSFTKYTVKGTPFSVLEIPIKPTKNSTAEGIFNSLGKETFIISLIRTTNTTSDVISKQNIKLI